MKQVEQLSCIDVAQQNNVVQSQVATGQMMKRVQMAK